MTDKVQKIREGIKKLKSQLIRGACSSQIAMETRCKEEAYDEVLAILDSLQKEPISTRDKLRALSDGKQHLGWLDDAREVEEESVSEGKDIFDNCLKSEEKFILPQKISGNINCENCLYSSACALGDIQACVIDKPVSEDLEEACEQLAENARKHKAETSSPFFSQTDYRQGVIDGAKWQKEQMMTKAFDGEILENYDGKVIKYDDTILDEKLSDCKVFDKVKIIVIKEG